jgi:hypothetical protein
MFFRVGLTYHLIVQNKRQNMWVFCITRIQWNLQSSDLVLGVVIVSNVRILKMFICE